MLPYYIYSITSHTAGIQLLAIFFGDPHTDSVPPQSSSIAILLFHEVEGQLSMMTMENLFFKNLTLAPDLGAEML